MRFPITMIRKSKDEYGIKKEQGRDEV